MPLNNPPLPPKTTIATLTPPHAPPLLRNSTAATPLNPQLPFPQNPNPQTPQPPSSLDRTGLKLIRSELPFDFRYAYTDSSPSVRPIGLREPKYSPFGPGRLDRQWTGVRVQGMPFTESERKVLVDKCQRHKVTRPRGKSISEMVPCILVTFEKEQIVVWRGKDYKPVEDGCFLPYHESFDDMDGSSSDGSLVCGEEGCDSVDGTKGQQDFHPGDDEEYFL